MTLVYHKLSIENELCWPTKWRVVALLGSIKPVAKSLNNAENINLILFVAV